jgi:hypothetical protein
MGGEGGISVSGVRVKQRILLLAGAVLIASAGFALIFALFTWLPYLGMLWVGKLPPAKIMILMPIPVFFLSLLTTALAVRGLRRIRKKHSNPMQTVLPL